MVREIRQAILFNLVTLLLLGGLYPLVLWGVGAAAFPAQAEGSLLRRPDGSVVGSRLIAQPFERPDYFQPRPSAVSFNAAGSGGSNLGPSNPDLVKAVAARLVAVRAREGKEAGPVPSELVTTSGSGLDPHIPPAAAALQAARIANARGVTIEKVSALIEAHTEPPLLGFLGRARVNVLELNLALDATFGPSGTEGGR
ncbi:MAG TPA: potassium-transporting ATPase subunit KdpC [Candidatus Polarisedimenticolia bacterium]|jgi:K+-transporting ATPase ATPase C chain|nr:potassium-transporting ATPase subunit KdpC [Candidatus Polarisedimenticolia bacterium]